ncbi:MFS transporter [Actinoplanes sichuanensis]|uniref:MFS transporter n=1 Tax=Actinoplanes sichuanensis TaxID=512349 RepID=A0ABW4A429_9ACTN|nr:MFS transporter [Actinoplanes sichuanensis]BEL05676.1 MFS transporter [Actinoplanes sichuanensis]
MSVPQSHAAEDPRPAGPVKAAAIGTSVLLLAYCAFISLGLPDGLLGVGWPSMAGELRVSTDSVGVLLFASTVGYLLSSVAAGFTLVRLGVGRLLAGSTALAALALAGYAAAPGLGWLLPCALVAGFGGGAIDTGLNAYAANAFGPRHMNWLHAFFGLGVAVGPLIMTGVLGGGLSWRWGYGLVAGAQALLAVAFVVSARAWAPHRAADTPGAAANTALPRVGATLRMPAVWFSMSAFAVYVGLEVATGLWAYLLLTEDRAVSATAAGLCVSAYWASLFVGRVVQGFTVERLGTTRTLVGGLVGMLAGAVLMAVPGPAWSAVAGLMVIGFAAAPVFPLLTLTTADRVGQAHADRVIGLQMSATGLGGVLIPAGVGVLVERVGEYTLGPSLTVLAVALLALYAGATRYRARAA